MRMFQHAAGHPYHKTIDNSTITTSVKNSPIDKRYVELATGMLGKSKFVSQGKITRSQPSAVDAMLQQTCVRTKIK